MTSRALAAALAVLALTGTACLRSSSVSTTDDFAIAEPAPMPPPIAIDPPVGQEPGGEPGGGDTGEAQQVALRDDVQNPSPVAWERTSWTKDTGELTVFWISGVEPCTVTAAVDVEYFDDRVEVTVLEGAPPEAATISCIMMAVSKQYTVTLDEDLAGRRIVDGSV